MTQEEKHALVAERLEGWPKRPDPWQRYRLQWMSSHHCGEQGYNPMLGDTCPQCSGVSSEQQELIDAEQLYRQCPNYSTDLNLCARVEARIEQMGRATSYLDHLRDAVGGSGFDLSWDYPDEIWALVSAPASARVDAMVALIQGMDK